MGSAVFGAVEENEHEGEAGVKNKLVNDVPVFILMLDFFSSSFEEV